MRVLREFESHRFRQNSWYPFHYIYSPGLAGHPAVEATLRNPCGKPLASVIQPFILIPGPYIACLQADVLAWGMLDLPVLCGHTKCFGNGVNMNHDNGVLLDRRDATLKMKSIAQKKSEWAECATTIILIIVISSLCCITASLLL
ncbi:MAG: hypothetical protein HY306_09180 [Nitrosomonadales bacterium]|nr:hypothetical protein [Nitrosomonadales bacterium]